MTFPSVPALETMISRRRILLALAALPLSRAAEAQSGAGRPLRLVVGFAPSSGPDQVARIMAPHLAESLQQPIVVDNRVGASGQIAAANVAKSSPDGGAILLGEVGAIAIAPSAYAKLTYDPSRELVPLTEAVRSEFVLLSPAGAPFQNLKDMVRHAKGQSGGFNFATFGAGSPGHFGAEMLARETGFKVQPVHYRSPAEAVTGLIAGDVQALYASTALAVAQLKGDKLRGLATTARDRLPQLPEVPTLSEAGYPKASFAAWFAFLAPVGTPEPQLERWSRQITNVLQIPKVRQQLTEAGFAIVGSTRSDATRMVREESDRWAEVVKSTGFKGD